MTTHPQPAPPEASAYNLAAKNERETPANPDEVIDRLAWLMDQLDADQRHYYYGIVRDARQFMRHAREACPTPAAAGQTEQGDPRLRAMQQLLEKDARVAAVLDCNLTRTHRAAVLNTLLCDDAALSRQPAGVAPGEKDFPPDQLLDVNLICKQRDEAEAIATRATMEILRLESALQKETDRIDYLERVTRAPGISTDWHVGLAYMGTLRAGIDAAMKGTP